MSIDLEEAQRTVKDYDATKKKLALENADLLRQLEEVESELGKLKTLKVSLNTQLEDSQKLADEEARVSLTCVSNTHHS